MRALLGPHFHFTNYIFLVYFLYFTAVSTVGYGDISPTIVPSKFVVICFIIFSLVVIPMQVNQLTVLLSMTSQFRQPFVPSQNGNEAHIIVCGAVGDAKRLENVFKEFFHPDRANSQAPDFHLLILSPIEPSEAMKILLLSTEFDAKTTYLIGSALSIDDLQKARADIAAAMIFLCDTEGDSKAASLDDAATVLRTLSVSNFNPELECLVQVIKREDRELLKDRWVGWGEVGGLSGLPVRS